jgi:hypothetical protein
MWTVIGSIAIVIGTIIVGMFVDRRWSLLPRKEELQLAGGQRPLLAGQVAGEAPATAITASIGEIERLRRTQKCPRCKLALDSAADDAVSYEGHPLRVLRFTCARCSGLRSVYVKET